MEYTTVRTTVIDTPRKHENSVKKGVWGFDLVCSGYLDYATLPGGMKAQDGVSWSKGKNRSSKRQEHKGNFRGIPKNGLTVWDIDASGSEADKQLNILLNILEIDRSEAAFVLTPRGGYHVYTLWAEGGIVTKPRNGKLWRLHPELTGDTKTSRSNSYVIIPPSYIVDEKTGEKRFYETGNFWTIPRLSESVCKKINELNPTDYEDERRGTNGEFFADLKKKKKVRRNENTVNLGLNSRVENRVRQGLQRANITTFHQQRAWVKKALSCHFSDSDIASFCIELGIDKDTNSGNIKVLTYKTLMTDISRLDASTTCGYVCSISARAKQKVSYSDGITLEQAKELKKRSEAKPSKHRAYRVLNAVRAAQMLSQRNHCRKPGKAQRLAYSIVLNELATHLAEGRKNIMLARAYLTERYNISNSQADRALRVLREAGIIEIHRLPSEGMTTLYRVNERLTDYNATKVLNATIAHNSYEQWGFHKVEVDYRTGNIWVLDVETGEYSEITCRVVRAMWEKVEEEFGDLVSDIEVTT